MRRWVWVPLTCLLAFGSARAGDAAQDEGQKPPPPNLALRAAEAANPQPAWTRDPSIVPARAVGRTHDCTSFYPTDSTESGDAMGRYDVGKDGVISSVALILSTGHDDLDQAALACVRQAWADLPATQNGAPVATLGHLAIIRFSNPPPPRDAPPPPPAPVVGMSPSRAIGRTHDCSSYYPDESRRQYETGDILVGYDVGVDGAISNVHVLKGSGFQRLDDAALSCVREAFRNTPALLKGVPVASPNHQAIIRFSISQPESAEDFYDRGVVLGERGDTNQALSDLTMAIALAPAAADPYRARAVVYDKLGQKNLAAADRAKADSLTSPHR
jgi:TonB family protein